MQPKVSIIVPCWNVDKYLNRCVESLVNQSLKNIEIILVDDESPDSVPQMCEEWKSKDSRIKVIHKKNAGLGMARNSGLEVANGEYVAFCDSDDYVDLKAYETLYHQASKLSADVLFGWHFKETIDHHWVDCCQVQEQHVFTGEHVKDFLLDLVAYPPNYPTKKERAIDVSSCMALYRNSLLKKHFVNFLSERDIVSEDLVFNVDFLLHANVVAMIPYRFYYYCQNDTSLSQTFKPSKFEGFKRLRQVLCNTLKHIDPNDYRTNRMFIGYCRAHLNALMRSDCPNKHEIIKSLVVDPVWTELRMSYQPEFLPIHSRISYILTLNSHSTLLAIYSKAYNLAKRLLRLPG